jgi:hypothetical protein
MPKRFRIDLSAEEENQLKRWTKNPPRPYLRRRAWAILLVAEGQPVYGVALDRRVRANRMTVAEWVERFQTQRIQGLRVQPGQGRKPAFSPSAAKRSQTPD